MGVFSMLWIDKNFDYNDQLAYKYMKYQGKYYDKGTKVKIRGPYGPVDVVFVGWRHGNSGCFESLDNTSWALYNTYDCQGVNKYVLEIIEPVHPNLQLVATSEADEREKPPSWDVEVMWVWYVVIMLVLTLFKARLIGWIATTVIFFVWKNGLLNGGKK